MAVVRFPWWWHTLFSVAAGVAQVMPCWSMFLVVVAYLWHTAGGEVWQRYCALILTSKKMPYLFSLKVEKKR